MRVSLQKTRQRAAVFARRQKIRCLHLQSSARALHNGAGVRRFHAEKYGKPDKAFAANDAHFEQGAFADGGEQRNDSVAEKINAANNVARFLNCFVVN